jgi:sec-independent protein translocase protein TatA
MEGKVGIPELILILGIALLVFGPSKLGALGKGLGEAISGFKSAMNGTEKPAGAPDRKPLP